MRLLPVPFALSLSKGLSSFMAAKKEKGFGRLRASGHWGQRQ